MFENGTAALNVKIAYGKLKFVAKRGHNTFVLIPWEIQEWRKTSAEARAISYQFGSGADEVATTSIKEFATLIKKYFPNVTFERNDEAL